MNYELAGTYKQKGFMNPLDIQHIVYFLIIEGYF